MLQHTPRKYIIWHLIQFLIFFSNDLKLFLGVALNNEDCSHAVKVATDEIQQLLLRRLSRSVAGHLVKSADCLKDTYVGTLQRCLESLEKNCHEQDASLLASDAVKQVNIKY